jgi:hypothetical protein
MLAPQIWDRRGPAIAYANADDLSAGAMNMTTFILRMRAPCGTGRKDTGLKECLSRV